jgi:hypothetical protein
MAEQPPKVEFVSTEPSDGQVIPPGTVVLPKCRIHNVGDAAWSFSVYPFRAGCKDWNRLPRVYQPLRAAISMPAEGVYFKHSS